MHTLSYITGFASEGLKDLVCPQSAGFSSCATHDIFLCILNIVCIFVICTIIHYAYSYFHCFYNMGHVLVGNDGNSRVYRCTMKQIQKECVVLFEESEYELAILEAYWQWGWKIQRKIWKQR